jgi:hypothetical protein
MIKKAVFFLIILMGFSLYSQVDSFSKYQYIIVSDKFDFLKDTDKFQTSSLTKFLFQKKGFKVFLSNEKLPVALNANRCLALFVSVIDESSMLTVKNSIEVKDCFGKIVYKSDIGKSKSKDYKIAYHEAIRDAFAAMVDFEYSYDPSSLAKKQPDTKVVHIESKSEVDLGVSIPEIKDKSNKQEEITANAVVVLYAQTIENGFQLVNTKPEAVFLILRTTRKDFFILKNRNGNFYKNGDNWLAEYYEDGTLLKKEFQVKF